MIEYPVKTSEAEIKAHLWLKLTEAGVDAKLEIRADRSRLDIVIFEHQIAKGIIECKSWSKKYARNQKYQQYKNSKRYKKYRDTFHIPVFVCGCQASIKPAIHFALKCIA